MHTPLRFASALLITASLVAPSTAGAQERSTTLAPSTSTASASANAAESKTRADRAMDHGRYDEALSAYRDAFAIEPSPALLYNMGRAQEKLGNYADALTTLEAFSAAAPPDLKVKVPRLEGLMSDLRARVARLTIRTNVSGARVYLGKEPAGTTPFASPVAVMPGVSEVSVRADGYAIYSREVSLDAGTNIVVDVALVPASAAAGSAAGEAPGASTPVTKQWWFWTGVGVVILGGAAITVAMLTPRPAPQGDIEPRQVTAPLLRF